ncbi:lantibiotic dehydratase [Actinoallomurus bryophytorum]|uniref:Thiopeptide-type bacteriocin biosynthesis protein n=1 Tax=Actinoallomurus bryophytorum TaxID=1490222 RepID=A0A543BZK8_9ACTN|nr:lantibiotic dehydratase [Actinoallomurus bryophytorum]TQL90257.1 thiopeptide-type bacteriocin biosynthesis protein [Actinoallomurus bryophytorum]
MTKMPRLKAADRATVRMSVLPAETAARTRSDGDDPAGYLRSIIADPLVREAIAVSSPSLAHTLDALEAGRPVDPKKLRRAVLSVSRYVLRMATRSTPFGIMAGVSEARFGDAVKTSFGDGHRKSARPDVGWLHTLVRDWERRPEIVRRLHVVRNGLAFARGDRIVVPHLPVGDDGPAIEVSVRRTRVVDEVLERARRPVRFTDLAGHLLTAFPQGSPEAVERMLMQLVERYALLTDLMPPDDADPIQHVLDRLPAEAAADLEETGAALDAYARTPVGGGLPAWNEVLRVTRRLGEKQHAPHVDLRLDDEITLPWAVAEEVESTAAILTRITPPDRAVPHMRAYHDDFVDRYGTGRLVPVKELLDPEAGLGTPAGYRTSARSAPRAEPNRYRDRVFGELTQRALLDGAHEVELDAAMIDWLADDDDGRVPSVLELGIHVLAASAPALEAGDFRIALATMPLSRRAGALSGRFAYLLDDLRDQTAQLLSGAKIPQPQLTFQANWTRVANVARVPRLTAHSLPVGRFADPGDPSVVDLDDLAVGSADGRLFLQSLSRGTEIVPTTIHMLVLREVAPDVARFLYDVSDARHRACAAWTWGDLDAMLPFLPRVRHGRTIMAPATWRPSLDLVDTAVPDREWQRRLDAWRERWRVPAEVFMTNGDNRIGLDLDATLHRRILRYELGRRKSTLLVEPPGGEGFGAGWADGRAGELVVTLTSDTPDPAVRTRAVVRRRPYVHHPGGEWLFAKLYCSADRHGELIARSLPVLRAALPSCVDRWFFMRYFDPGPHLRLRFQGDPDGLNREVMPLVHQWAARLCEAGLARTLMLDTYEPEVERYGGPEALEAAERLFQADSEAVIEQLGLRLDLRPELLAAANYADLMRGFDAPDWREWFLHAFPKNEHHSAFQAVRRTAIPVVEGQVDPRLDAIWARRRPAVAEYGRLIRSLNRPTPLPALLHMHHNRLVGAAPDGEGVSYAITRGALQALWDRERHAK